MIDIINIKIILLSCNFANRFYSIFHESERDLIIYLELLNWIGIKFFSRLSDNNDYNFDKLFLFILNIYTILNQFILNYSNYIMLKLNID